MKSTASKTIIPRNFILLDALNKAVNYNHVSYGLCDEDESKYKNNYVTMEYWTGSMTYDDGENYNIFNFEVQCTKKYPQERPIVQFADHSIEHRRLKKTCDENGKPLTTVLDMVKYSETMLLGDYLTSLLTAISTYR